MLATYFARTVLTVQGSLRRGRAPLLEPMRFSTHVWPTDIDLYGHMNNGRYLTHMDFGRLDHFLRTGLVSLSFKRRWRPLLGAASASFKRELLAGQRFELVTQLSCWNDKWFFYEHHFERAGRSVAVGFAKGIVKQGRTTVPPATLFGELGHTGPSPEPSAELRHWIDGEH